MSSDQLTDAGPVTPRTGAPPGGVFSGARELLARIMRLPSISVLIATVALTLFIGALHPQFLHTGQLLDILQASSYVGLIAIGMSYLIAMREIDLSVGSAFGLSVIGAAIFMEHGWNPWLAAGGGIVIGGVLGLVNAILVTFVRIPTIVATLATLSVYRGLAIGTTNGQQVTNFNTNGSFFTVLGGHLWGVPFSVYVLVVVAVPLAFAMHHTKFGYRVLALGSNPEAAQFSGISLPRVRTQVLILVGLLCGVGGMLGLAFFSAGDPNIGSGFELQAIAAAVIGGTPLRGGSGTVFGAVLGAILLNVVSSGLSYFNIPANWSAFGTGLVILLAVGLDSFVRRRRRGRQPARAL
ncbi:MAG: ABC transporter permease [Jatrophihabitantaceae bacterium]